MDIKAYLQKNRIIADGAMGTYYASLYGESEPGSVEGANITHPERVEYIHEKYVSAGANLIRTNTFAANTAGLNADLDKVIANVQAGVSIAQAVAAKAEADNIQTEADKTEAGIGKTAAENKADKKIFVAGDIGPVPADANLSREQVVSQYKAIGSAMQDMGVDIIWFETFGEFEVLLPVVEYLKGRSSTPIMVSFCVNQFGYSNFGFSARALLNQAGKCDYVDGVGFNCGVGPYHMLKLLEKLDLNCGKMISVMPNAGYPKFNQSRLVFSDNRENFVDKIGDIARLGADFVGGCCGTNPKYVENMAEVLDMSTVAKSQGSRPGIKNKERVRSDSFLKRYEENPGHKIIAVELAPPMEDDDQKMLDAAHVLNRMDVDVVTIPDSPSGRTRADSVLMAAKIMKETGLRVMPHISCRDKNAIAIRASVLGARLNDIKDFLVITGDPVPVMFRQSTRSVFNFDSVGMMELLGTMNDEVFADGDITYGGAINQNRTNIQVEIARIKKKRDAGAKFFISQPVFTEAQAQILREIKNELGVTLIVGIMPLVSRRNALFMKNEMAGIEIPDEVVERYGADFTRQEGETCGVNMAKEIISFSQDFADGYYFSFPFNRVHMLEKILNA